MIVPRCGALLAALRTPEAMAGFDEPTWDLVARQATAAGLLARLGTSADETGIGESIPVSVRRHLNAAKTFSEQQQRAVRWELMQLTSALEELAGPVLLLKGAAYAAAGLPPARGRLFSDIDLLVPKDQLPAAEAALMLAGWATSHDNPYDQRYYRRWMHELPPMTHLRRGTVIDLHHNILPETSRVRTQAAPLIVGSVELASFPRFRVPCDTDLVLHSAAHLFLGSEWQRALRDLVDIDAMLRSFGAEPGFWRRLTARAAELNLQRPLFYALRHAARLLGSPVPDEARTAGNGRPAGVLLPLMDTLFATVIPSVHHTCRARGHALAEGALYVRGHWLRMPLRLLVPHLLYKFWHRRWERIRPHGRTAGAADRRP